MKNILKIGGLIVLLLSLSVKVDACWPYSPLDWYGDPDDGSWTGGGSGGSNNLPVSIAAGSISQNQNYIVTATPYKAVGGGVLNNSNSNITIQYYDGLGRPVETVQKGITPAGNDLVTYQEYDGFGRESNSWLPAVASGNNGAFIPFETYKSKSVNTYYNTSINVAADVFPYAYPVYEPSPLNRALQQFGPGAEWQRTNKAVSTDYQTNSGTSGELSCALFTVTGTGVNIKVNKNNFYGSAQLYVTKTTDEDGNVSYEFKDKLGHVVLMRQMLDGVGLDTYYVHDNFGNLCFVLPPMASEELIKTNNIAYDDVNNTQIKQYAYIYKYDSRNRCIWKKLPGCEPVYSVYDNADRLIFTQDGENRKAGIWQFSIPDMFGRIALMGTCKDSLNYAADKPLGDAVVKASYDSLRTNVANSYKITGVTLTNMQALTANYYDNYNFMGMAEVPNNSNTQYNAEDGHNDRYTGSYTGLLTGTVTAVINTYETVYSTYLYSVMYYDYKGNVIQTKSNNHLNGGIEKEYVVYNFAGQPTGKKHILSATLKPTQTEGYGYQYDNAGRLKTEMHQLNNGQITAIAENTYDELGRLKTNMKGGLGTLKATYGYNIRSWVKSIASPLFTENLYYNESYGGSAKLYNGNISAMDWKVSGETNTRGYAFTYNNLSWLTNANYLENGSANSHYTTSYSYDKQGNIKTLQRYGKTTATAYGLIDNVTVMNYAGNQLLRVWDAAGNVNLAESADFKEYANDDIEYTYNANGAMTQDLNKGISDIQYNSLNLPRIIDIKSPVAEARNEYTYSVSGQKLKVCQRWNPYFSTIPVIGSDVNLGTLSMLKTTDYVGNMIYENGALKRILIDGGYIEGGQYYYYQTDHLGNNRVVANANGVVVQKNHYYPFGMAFAETSAAEQGKQPYKYGGKELDQMNGLNLYDVSARFYDPALPNTLTPDRHCENYYPISPYAWCMNNPLRFTDPTGKDTYLIIYGSGWVNPQMRGSDYDVGNGFKENAEAKKSQIEKSDFFTENDKVEVAYAATEDEYINAINTEYESGKIAGLDVYSHGSNNSVNLGGPADGTIETSPADADYRLVSAYPSAQNPDGNNEITRINSDNFTDKASVTFWGCNIGGSNTTDPSKSHAQAMANHLGGERTVNAFTGGGGAEFKVSNGKVVYDGTMIRSADKPTQQVKLTIFKPR